MRRLFAAFVPTLAAYAWRNRSKIGRWWNDSELGGGKADPTSRSATA